ncbi:MAG: ABC transporter ATP-binding protein [Mycobacteriales bacterium]
MSLALTGVHCRFGGVVALAGANLDIAPGEVVAVVGPNGSGKSTLVNVASGFLRPDAGLVAVDGRALGRGGPARAARLGVIRTFQGLRLFDGQSALDNVRVGAARGRRASLTGAWAPTVRRVRAERELTARAREALQAVGLAGLALRPVAALSVGQRRRVELARALAARPSYLVLDEPGAGLDPEAREELGQLVRRLAGAGAGVLLVEHDLDLAELACGRAVGIVAGQVVAAGSLAAVAAHPALAPYLRPLPALEPG